jgi:hypothetical protein
MNFEKSGQGSAGKKKEAMPMWHWKDGKLVEGAPPADPEKAAREQEQKIEIAPGMKAEIKLNEKVSDAEKQLDYQRNRLQTVSDRPASSYSFENGKTPDRVKQETIEATAATLRGAAERSGTLKLAQEKLSAAGTVEAAVASIEAEEAALAEKVAAKYKETRAAKQKGWPTDKLVEEHKELGDMLQRLANARQELTGL